MKNQIDKKSLYYENIGDKTIYYSYNTTVAVKTPIETYVSENVWSVTTAKHLNRIEELTELTNKLEVLLNKAKNKKA